MVKGNLSTYTALALLAASAFTAQPSLAAFIDHVVFIVPLLIFLVWIARSEGYKEARDQYAPGKPIIGHYGYRISEWLENTHFGVRGIWVVLGLVVMLFIYKWAFH